MTLSMQQHPILRAGVRLSRSDRCILVGLMVMGCVSPWAKCSSLDQAHRLQQCVPRIEMKRRLQGLASSTAKSQKRRSWQESESEQDDDGADQPDEVEPVETELVVSVQEDVSAHAVVETPGDAKSGGPNPVVWMDISVAGRPRGRVFFELFADVAPRSAEHFRALCVGLPEDEDLPDGLRVGYRGTEFHRVVPELVAEGGDLEPEVASRSRRDKHDACQLRHSKPGLLSTGGKVKAESGHFQITLRPMPELDGNQVVFGQVLISESTAQEPSRLHPLYWTGFVGSSSGNPWESVIVDDCGECEETTARAILGNPTCPEREETRYGRTGRLQTKLHDAVNATNLTDVLDLTDEVIAHFEYETKNMKQAASASERSRRSEGIEACLRAMSGALERSQRLAGEVTGFEGKLGRLVKTQVIRLKDLTELLARLY